MQRNFVLRLNTLAIQKYIKCIHASRQTHKMSILKKISRKVITFIQIILRELPCKNEHVRTIHNFYIRHRMTISQIECWGWCIYATTTTTTTTKMSLYVALKAKWWPTVVLCVCLAVCLYAWHAHNAMRCKPLSPMLINNKCDREIIYLTTIIVYSGLELFAVTSLTSTHIHTLATELVTY